MRILSRPRNTISSPWLVRVLASSGDTKSCSTCFGRMFVASRDGLCPPCRSADHQRDVAITGIVEEQLEAVSDWS
jgi:hypothetical protein